MQTRSAVEIARAALRDLFPTAPEDGLDEGARHLTRWGIEGHGTNLGSAEAALMYLDLVQASQESYDFVPDDVARAAEMGEASRTWRAPSRTRRG
ncbi:hypothetical protein GTY65_14980 [Streptomyces sp. SID8379]|uniref:hypothetical protein n=1 Tax=unclassified Streptomyces TaxID=2593676 RepID=UPI000362669E|nr:MULTISPECIES: hypothetical protein [unclassified Streptomyces]MYW65351.1 hypothetical protein [Streptomyces sp. SID8379]